jgi:hypothetical protein
MKTLSTKDTIGCATEVKQPLVPNLNRVVILIDGKQYWIDAKMYYNFYRL